MGEGDNRDNLRPDELLRRNADGATATRPTKPAITQKVEIKQGSSPRRKEAATGNEVLRLYILVANQLPRSTVTARPSRTWRSSAL